MPECESCRDERKKKKLAPVERIRLPEGVTDQGFRRPELPTFVCAHCDGESLVNSALAQYAAREK